MNHTVTTGEVVKPQRQRLDYIDQLKGISIFLVVIGHFIQFNVSNFSQNSLFSFIYSFHMPLFMFLSGYVAQKTTRPAIFGSYFSFLKKKAITLLVPFFFWPLFISPFLFGNRKGYDVLETVTGLVQDPNRGLWYLWFLFFLYIFYSVFLRLTTLWNGRNLFLTDGLIWLLIAGVIAGLGRSGVIGYGNTFLLYYFFFFTGVFLSKYTSLRTFLMHNLTFSAALLCFIVFGRLYRFDDDGQVNLVFKLVASVSAIASLYYIVNTISWHPAVQRQVIDWGKHSLIIYVTQASVILFFTNPAYLSTTTPIVFLLICIFCSLAVIWICIGISRIVELSRPLDLLFYGRIK